MEYTLLERKRFTEPVVDTYPLFISYEPNDGDVYSTDVVNSKAEEAHETLSSPYGGLIAFRIDRTWHILNNSFTEDVVNRHLENYTQIRSWLENLHASRLERTRSTIAHKRNELRDIRLRSSLLEKDIAFFEEFVRGKFTFEGFSQLFNQDSESGLWTHLSEILYYNQNRETTLLNIIENLENSLTGFNADLQAASLSQGFYVKDGYLHNMSPIQIQLGDNLYNFGHFGFKVEDGYLKAKTSGKNQWSNDYYPHPFMRSGDSWIDVCLGNMKDTFWALHKDHNYSAAFSIILGVLNSYSDDVHPYINIRNFNAIHSPT